MAYSKEEKETILNYIFNEIIEGRALRNVIKDEGMPDAVTFYKWIDEDEEKLKQYARATELRAEAIFDEILDIADDGTNDYLIDEKGNVTVNQEHIQRSRLRVDARKWTASKLAPKKYGDKLDVTTQGEKINNPPIFGSDSL